MSRGILGLTYSSIGMYEVEVVQRSRPRWRRPSRLSAEPQAGEGSFVFLVQPATAAFSGQSAEIFEHKVISTPSLPLFQREKREKGKFLQPQEALFSLDYASSHGQIFGNTESPPTCGPTALQNVYMAEFIQREIMW